jgi:hypothetical protein
MRKTHIPQPQKIRKIKSSFAWIDHRLVRNGFLQVMTHQEMALYLFLVLAADRHGVSFYRKEKMCDTLGLDFRELDIARDRLVSFKLVAFEAYTVLSPNGYYQILPIEGQAPNFVNQVMQKATDALTDKWTQKEKTDQGISSVHSP